MIDESVLKLLGPSDCITRGELVEALREEARWRQFGGDDGIESAIDFRVGEALYALAARLDGAS